VAVLLVFAAAVLVAALAVDFVLEELVAMMLVDFLSHRVKNNTN
jgi:hypothetical protein